MAVLYCMLLIVSCRITDAAFTLDLGSQSWTVRNANRSIETAAEVPGGIYSDLRKGGVLKSDILYRFNDLEYRWVGRDNWTYTVDFEITSDILAHKNIYLVLHGVDTVGSVYLNGVLAGKCNNMFVRFKFDVKDHLILGTNRLEVVLLSPIKEASRIASTIPYKIPLECWPQSYKGECQINKLRKMQASFAWDWGPAFPSVGLWKDVFLEMTNGPTIRSVGVVTRTEGSDWVIVIRAWFDSEDALDNSEVEGYLVASLFLDRTQPSVRRRQTVKLSLVNSHLEARISLRVPKHKVELWWPNGYGDQKLYDLTVSFKSGEEVSKKHIKIGFRDLQLVQDRVSEDPAKGLTFYFKVNGVPLFAKGSNWIPSHILPERSADPGRIKHLLTSAKQAHFNMIRVWGGGLYESDFFYETCDELGILVWQDMMFACNMYPTTQDFLASVAEEIRQQVKRLQHHPSVALWAGNNENEAALSGYRYGTVSNFSLYKDDYIKLYVDTVRDTVWSVDQTRPFVTSSPSNGIKSEEDGYVAVNPQDSLYGDVHYYNYMSDGWLWLIYPKTRFASEYGMQSLPCLATLAQASDPSDLVLGSDFLEHRQHLQAGYQLITVQINKNLPPFSDLKTLIYFSQINQAMTMKTETEAYRRDMSKLYSSGEGMTMGALYWQLNDIWQAPSWSSIDFSGTWKMLHYYARDFFAPVITSPAITADDRLTVTLVSDLLIRVPRALLSVSFYRFKSKDFAPAVSYTYNVSIPSSKSVGVLERDLKEMEKPCGTDDCWISTRLYSDEGQEVELSPENFLFTKPLNTVLLPEPDINISKVELKMDYEATIELRTDGLALFVWLEADNIEGIFSKNGFHMTRPVARVSFTSYRPLDLKLFTSRLRVTSLKSKY